MRPNSIAVVVPLYQKAPHVPRLMRSILFQTRAPDEVIIVDDRSTDAGPEAFLEYDCPSLTLLRRQAPGAGGYAARNLGIEAAQSEWIAFLDADDAWRPGALAEVERLIALADAGVSCIFTNYDRDYGGRILPSSALGRLAADDHTRLNFAGFIDAWLASGQSPMWTSAVVARRSALIAAGLFPAGKCNRGGDKDTWIRLLRIGDALCSGAVTATYHRDAVNMVTRTTGADQRPYLCGTLEALLPSLPPTTALAVQRLINREIYSHAREAWRHRLRIPRDLFRGYRATLDPVGYGVLRILAAAPDGLLNLSYTLRYALAGPRRRGAVA
ncbi:MAG: hypothetical protein JWR59_359 [Brevundimonas sp.]|nr:hypothetical protein [Brevundimonas sp.]